MSVKRNTDSATALSYPDPPRTGAADVSKGKATGRTCSQAGEPKQSGSRFPKQGKQGKRGLKKSLLIPL